MCILTHPYQYIHTHNNLFYIEGVRLEFISMLSGWSKKKIQHGDKALGQYLTLSANSTLEYLMILKKFMKKSYFSGYLSTTFDVSDNNYPNSRQETI